MEESILEYTKPEEIYNNLIKKISTIVESFETPSDDEDLNKAKQKVSGGLNKLKDNLENSLNELKSNSEWNKFTIAFYGETNAGKSTIIETLRILLKEQKKIEERNKFDKLLKKYDDLVDSIEELDLSIEKIISKYKKNIEILIKKLVYILMKSVIFFKKF